MRRSLTLLPLLALAAVAAACGDDPTTPSSPPVAEAPADPEPEAPASPQTKALPTGVSAFRLASAPDRVKHDISLDHFRNGIGRPDPRDAIPALSEPEFVGVAEAKAMDDALRVIVVELRGETRAYPLALLDRHELVNDEIQDVPILVSWCPLCGSAVVYDRVVDGHELTFGVSGYLYKSDVLMYDHQTESFWSQLLEAAVAGPFTGTTLRVRPCYLTSLGDLRENVPQARVLQRAKGMLPDRAYASRPYADYPSSDRIWFPVGDVRKDLPPKAEVIGVVVGEEAWAFPLEDLRALAGEAPEASFEHEIGGKPVKITYQAGGDAVRVREASGAELPATRLYWFAWAAFRPETKLWRPETDR